MRHLGTSLKILLTVLNTQQAQGNVNYLRRNISERLSQEILAHKEHFESQGPSKPLVSRHVHDFLR